jgi:hypothetical protein
MMQASPAFLTTRFLDSACGQATGKIFKFVATLNTLWFMAYNIFRKGGVMRPDVSLEEVCSAFRLLTHVVHVLSTKRDSDPSAHAPLLPLWNLLKPGTEFSLSSSHIQTAFTAIASDASAGLEKRLLEVHFGCYNGEPL